MDICLLLNANSADHRQISADRPLRKSSDTEPAAKRQKTTSTTPYGNPSEASSPISSPDVCEKQNASLSPPFKTRSISSNSLSSDTICFGMLNIPTTKCLPSSQPFEDVEIRQHGEIFSVTSNSLRGNIRSRHAQLLELFGNEHMEIDLRISSVNTGPGQFVLQAILYGDKDLGDGLKDVLRGQNLFLQDPYGADRDVVYWNPQRYCNSPERRTSDFFATNADQKTTEELIKNVDLLAAFTSGDDLNETEPSCHLRTPLKPHQKQALSFMISRERGWNFHVRDADVWSLKQNSRQTAQEFLNNVSGTSQYVSPPDFRGGIIADSMGSGKTLSMIALIAHDRIIMSSRPNISMSGGVNTAATLVIVPPPLLKNWSNELSSHLSDAEFSWASHHSKSKISSVDELQGIDVLLTTYPTVATEWRKKGHESVLFSHHWHRTILDEAHYIKNPSRATTKAICHIQSSRRWAVTGTPIQNSPSDLQSILCFIRAYPYSDKAVFDYDINHKLMSGEEEEAVNRLKRLLSFLMLRRSNSSILPLRSDFIQTVEFDAEELAAYRKAAEMTLVCINSALQVSHADNGYINALQKINTLRRICNLGHLRSSIDSEILPDVEYSREAVWDQATARRALNQFLTLGLNLNCVRCQQPMDNTAQESEHPVLGRLTQCRRLWCEECFNYFISSTGLCDCEPLCPVVELSVHSPTLREGSAFSSRRHGFPTKVRALINDLKEQPSGSKSIVFSSWKTTLDMVHAALSTAKIPCVQVDGTVPGKRRWEIFDRFRSDHNIGVLLLTLSCGAVGLTLTAASRAYLMEPQWNPAVEEQALSRIHRIGQTKNVTTVRFIMDNSIEQHVVEIQKSKRDLIKVLMSPRTSSLTRDLLERVRQCVNRSLA